MKYIVKFYSIIYNFYYTSTENEDTSKIQTIGLVSILSLFVLNFIISLSFYYFEIPFSSIGYTFFLFLIMVVFTISTVINRKVFNIHSKEITASYKGTFLLKLLVFLTIFFLLGLGFYSFELYRLSNN